MPDEEKTDWTGIAARLRELVDDMLQCFKARDSIRSRKAGKGGILLPEEACRADEQELSQTVLALAEAERMVPRDVIDSMNYCPTCACKLPRPRELRDFVCPESGDDPSFGPKDPEATP